MVEQEDIFKWMYWWCLYIPQHRGNGYARIMVDKLVVEAKRLVGPLGFVFYTQKLANIILKWIFVPRC